MAGTFIDALPAATSALLTDVFPVDQLPGPITKQESNAQLLSLFEANIVITPANFSGVLPPANGGTGINNGTSTLTLGGNLTTSGAFASTFTMTAATSVTFPTSGTLATTSQLPTLPLSLANGGTNASLTASNGGIFYSTASAAAILSGTTTANQMLQSGASTSPSWSTSTWPSTTTISQILYSSSANVVSGLSTLNNGVLITGATGIPALLANSGSAGFVLTANSGAPPSWQNITAEGAITTINGDAGSVTPSSGAVTISGGTTGLTTSGSSATLNLTGTLKLANGGTNASLTASNGGIFYSTATAGAILSGTSTATQMLQSGATGAPAWSTTTWPATSTINQILFSSSANTVTGLGTANSAVLVTGSTGVPVFSGTMTNGQIIIGSTTATPTAATLTAGTGVTITNGAASITIASNGAGPWVDETGATVTMTTNTGYTADDGATLVTLTLPTTSAIGDFVEVNGKGAGLWQIAQATGQQIHIGTSTTTSGATGSLASVNQYDNVRLRCLTANTIWSVVSQQSSGLTVV